jgi:hypothetical protein
MQCSNNLKQCGIGLHNFHDVQQGIVPLTIGADSNDYMRLSFFPLLYPFIEQVPLYDLFATNTWVGTGGITFGVADFSASSTGPQWWINAKTEYPDFEKIISGVSIYRCPTRRGNSYTVYTETAVSDIPGPLGDYAAPILPLGTQAWADCYRHNLVASYRNFASPLRVALHHGTITTSSKSFSSRDNFAWWTDGLSNQLVLGEKHIPKDFIGISKNVVHAGVGMNHLADDCTYLVGGRWGLPGCARNILSLSSTLCSANDYPAPGIDPLVTPGGTASHSWNNGMSSAAAFSGQFDFGSAHSGICNFLLGDGSVRSISVTVPKHDLLAYLVHVNDGTPIQLP